MVGGGSTKHLFQVGGEFAGCNAIIKTRGLNEIVFICKNFSGYLP